MALIFFKSHPVTGTTGNSLGALSWSHPGFTGAAAPLKGRTKTLDPDGCCSIVSYKILDNEFPLFQWFHQGSGDNGARCLRLPMSPHGPARLCKRQPHRVLVSPQSLCCLSCPSWPFDSPSVWWLLEGSRSNHVLSTQAKHLIGGSSPLPVHPFWPTVM